MKKNCLHKLGRLSPNLPNFRHLAYRQGQFFHKNSSRQNKNPFMCYSQLNWYLVAKGLKTPSPLYNSHGNIFDRRNKKL